MLVEFGLPMLVLMTLVDMRQVLPDMLEQRRLDGLERRMLLE